MYPVLESVNEATPFEPYICGEKVNFSYLAHYHKELEIIKVNDGETLIIKNGQRVKLSVGDIMFISPFEIHEYISFGRNSMAVMKFCVPDDFPETVVDSVIAPNDERYAKLPTCLTIS